MKRELVDLSDEVWERTCHRLEGLTDDEYFWEPAPGCWTLRPRPDGTWRIDWPLPRPDPEPFTTIAWRLWHLTDMYGEERAPRWLGVTPQGEAIGFEGSVGPASNARDALALLDRAHERWDAHLALVTDDDLGEKIGPVGGGYAERTRAAYVLHMLDEYVHHGAEIATLRDLWRWQHPLGVASNTERAMRGDDTLADEVDGDEASELMSVAAEYARWPLVIALVEKGARVPGGRRSPLHLAAGAGELGVVELLVANGADIEARDPEYNARPVEWATFLRQPHVVDWLRQASTSSK